MTETAGWVYDPTPKHMCMTPGNPELSKHMENAIWKCGECGQFWEVYWDQPERKKDMRPISPVDVSKRMQVLESANT